MFSQAKQGSMLSLGIGPSGVAANDKARSKQLTQAEKYEQALVTAKVFLEDSRARMTKSMDKYNAVVNSSYWFYGYFGGNMVATMAACLALGNRWAFFRSYSGWIALLGGYGGGKACLGAHSSVLLGGVVGQLDHEIEEAKRMDEQTGHIVPDYLREAERLTQVKYELVPTLPEAIAARAHHTERTLDDRADALVEAYMKRKAALGKK
ncbi:hypothetical protein LSCM1_03449 [Leishmania martiniquensis]|uniref:Uncharacterized protein n=1 Tax=Leishmania martiniquensis TaxID=1580590 RepID=A0A836GHV1_9TRYP|nr:hypothetical protein LSCM1_03449 [Leishmania martiniquensis]